MSDYHRVRDVDSLEALTEWARERDVPVRLEGFDIHFNRIFAATDGDETLIAKAPPEGEPVLKIIGFQT